jgi:hypothetical protein
MSDTNISSRTTLFPILLSLLPVPALACGEPVLAFVFCVSMDLANAVQS